MGDFKDLIGFQKAFQLAMEIFKISKEFPPEEKFFLTSQIRRSSRSVCANFAEGYRKRRYRAHFLSKLSDCESENTETEVWIDFAYGCNYIDQQTHIRLFSLNSEVRRLIFHMINNPDKYL